jgi:head-tail adaptor
MSPLIPAAELAQMRADILDNMLPDTCNILSVTRTADGEGGWTEAWGTASTSVNCRLDGLNSRESIAGAAVQPFHTYVLTVPWDTTITTDYRVEHGTVTYEIKSVKAGSWMVCTRVLLEALL